MVLTPGKYKLQLKKDVKKRIEKAIKGLPRHWTELFLIRYPEYAGKESHLANVRYGRSTDMEVLTRMEHLAELIKPTK